MSRIASFPAICLLLSTLPLAAQDLSQEERDFFESKIRPVLVRECYGCHSNQTGNARGGLRLDTRELMQLGGSSGPAVVPGDLDESWLYNAITHQDFEMPPRRRLPQNVIDDFRVWIEMGAPDPRVTSFGTVNSTITEADVQHAKETFWAYQQPAAQQPPQVLAEDWPVSAIDSFVLSRLEQENMQPAADAEPRQILRRLYFDLIGLPPSPDQLSEFAVHWDRDPDAAVADTVDRLLQSKHFGERWGRHWLDVARYAESTGSQVNMTYPHAWRYRDYVIDAFNNDKPFDQFVREQIAGDLLPDESDEDWAENLIATTFLAIGPKNVNEQNRVQFEADVIDEQIDATTRVFLGTSVACARCHDHKFDAIPQTDYYALAGVFGSMTTYFGNPPSEYGTFSGIQTRRNSSLILLPVEDPSRFDRRYSPEELQELRNEIEEQRQALVELRSGSRRLSGSDAANAQRQRIRAANQLADLSAKLAVVDENGQPRSYTMGVLEKNTPADRRLLVRGEIDQPAQTVERGFPRALCSEAVSLPADSSGRRELAEWIGSDNNPLTARVMVNRVWQHLLGRGIVASPENFGTTGQPPSHPELLDHLAVQFVEHGWSVKSVIRAIATSRVYRMASTFREDYHQVDPDNRLLWRANIRRLDAEVIRDAMLAVSGELDPTRPRGSEVARAGYTRVQGGVLGNPREIARRTVETAVRDTAGNRFRRNGPFRGGPGREQAGRAGVGRGTPFGGRRAGGMQPGFGRSNSVQDAFAEAARQITHQLDMEHADFRSVYLPVVRDEVPRSLEVFDFADASAITGQRESSNTANQALYLLNNRFVIRQSDAMARRIAAQSRRPAEQIEQAFLLAWGRSPTSRERDAVFAFVRSFTAERSSDPAPSAALAAVCQSLLAAAEFRYLD